MEKNEVSHLRARTRNSRVPQYPQEPGDQKSIIDEKNVHQSLSYAQNVSQIEQIRNSFHFRDNLHFNPNFVDLLLIMNVNTIGVQGGIAMRKNIRYLLISPDETRVILRSLIRMKNRLIQEGRYTDCVDELIAKIAAK